MAIKFEKIQAGMTLYDRHRHKMGNTTMTTLGEWPVYIKEVYPETRSALVSWNSNRPTEYSERQLSRLCDWSMRDDDAAIRSEGIWGRISKVTRRKPCQKCKTRHASEECPPKKETPSRCSIRMGSPSP